MIQVIDLHSSGLRPKQQIDDVPVERVQAFEKGFMEFVSQHYDHIRRTLLETKELTSDLLTTIKEACAEYKKTFLAVEEV